MMRRLLPCTLLLLCSQCSSVHPPESAGTEDEAVAVPDKANIVLVLTDDLSWNLVEYMPHVRAMQRRGATFTRFFVTDSLCCPSRTSLLTGKFPHDTGVFTNSGNDGGYATFLRRGNEAHTFGTALTHAGYTTSFMGKYLNGYDPHAPDVPAGWARWHGVGNGYPEYDYTMSDDGTPHHYGSAPADYLTDVLSRLGVRFIEHNADKPFMLEVATFAPHAPYTPAHRHEHMFPGLKVPRGPAFGARPTRSAPRWLKEIPPLDGATIDHMDEVFRKRAQAVQAVDEMIGALERAIADTGHAKDTYLVFTSDNGYHIGEHSLRAGKQTAFETDIRVPLVVVGPGITPGTKIDHIAQNIDLCATFGEMGHGDAPIGAEGRSLMPLLLGKAVPNWRDAALIEHHGPDIDPLEPDAPEAGSGNPTTYEALRTEHELYVEYRDGEREYYDLDKDPHELDSAFDSLPAPRADLLHKTLTAIKNCHDREECWAAQHLQR